MYKADRHFDPSEMPTIADQILRNYKHDRSYFEHYSPKFDQVFLNRFEEKVDTLVHHPFLQAFENEIAKTNEKIMLLISHVEPLINLTEALLKRVPKISNIPVSNFDFDALRGAISLESIGEIKRSCYKIISEFNRHLEKFIDLGFVSILLSDFQVLSDKLRDAESELAELTHQYNLIAHEFIMVDHQLNDILETILNSNAAVFGQNNPDKTEEYSVEKIMLHAQFIKTRTQ